MEEEPLFFLASRLEAERDFAHYIVECTNYRQSLELIDSILLNLVRIHEALKAMLPPDKLMENHLSRVRVIE